MAHRAVRGDMTGEIPTLPEKSRETHRSPTLLVFARPHQRLRVRKYSLFLSVLGSNVFRHLHWVFPEGKSVNGHNHLTAEGTLYSSLFPSGHTSLERSHLIPLTPIKILKRYWAFS